MTIPNTNTTPAVARNSIVKNEPKAQEVQDPFNNHISWGGYKLTPVRDKKYYELQKISQGAFMGHQSIEWTPYRRTNVRLCNANEPV